MEAGLRINDVNDPAEREADRVAAAVMAAPAGDARPPAVVASPGPVVQRKCAACEEEEGVHVQRKESSPTQPTSVPPIVGQVLNSPGQPLDHNTRDFMESRIGCDLSGVRVHTDAHAADSAKAIDAEAYTVGRDIVFGTSKYQPQNRSGRTLLAHELAHVAQNGGSNRPAIQRRAEDAPEQLSAQRFRRGPVHPTSTRVDAAIELVRRALIYATDTPPQNDKALDNLAKVEGFLRPLIQQPNIDKYYKGGMEKTGVQMVAGSGVDAVKTIQGQIRSGLNASAGGRSGGLWDYYFGQVLAAREFLMVLSGEAAPRPYPALNYDEVKESFYTGLINVLTAKKAAVVRDLRTSASKLPTNWQSTANTLIDIVSFVLDMFIALILAIVGLIVGFVEGIVGMLLGIVKLVIGIVKLLKDAIQGLFTNFDAFKADIDAIVTGFNNIPKGLKIIVGGWWERFKKASPERQALMGGELVGQIEAFIATFAFAGTKVGQAPELTVATQLEVRTVVQTTSTGLPQTSQIVVTGTKTFSGAAVAAPAAAGTLVAPALMSVAATGGGGPGGGGGSGGGGSATPLVRGKNITVSGTMTEAAFKESMKTEARMYIYELVDSEGNHLKWGTATDPYTRFNGYVGEGLGSARMRVYPPQARYQALGGETRGIQSELEQGRGGLNVRTETRAEMRQGADWSEILEQPQVPRQPLITISR
jgi:hypothetical protein